MKHHRQTLRGFSMIELVIGFALLLLLVAIILFPIAQSARATMASTVCVNNLRQIYSAMMLFAIDHGGLLPPDLGYSGPESRTAAIHPAFNLNSYWWRQAYIGRYILDDLSRHRDSRGKLTQEEAEVFNCPGRFVEGPDENWQDSNGNPAVSYVMRKVRHRYQFQFYTNPLASSKVMIMDGRSSTFDQSNAVSGPLGAPSSSGRLRRYHNGALNQLFFDGHINSFSKDDSELQPMVTWPSQ